MKEHPILMQTDMVKAILDGRKTQIRRVIKPQPPSDAKPCTCTRVKHFYIDKVPSPTDRLECTSDVMTIKCPYGQVGDRLWVRETWQVDDWNYPNHKEAVLKENLEFRADATTEEEYYNYLGWKSPLHLDKIFARIWLEITGVRVERLQEITEVDAIAEGVSYNTTNEYAQMRVLSRGQANEDTWPTPQESFRKLWDSLNAKRGYGWEVNLWVWVIEFKRVDNDKKND